MIIVIFITIFILFIFFLLSLKSVEILYQEKENLKNINLSKEIKVDLEFGEKGRKKNGLKMKMNLLII